MSTEQEPTITWIDFDLESDGLLDEVTRVHVLQIGDKTWRRRRNDSDEYIRYGVRWLCELSKTPGFRLSGHNVIKYDVPVLRKLYPEEMEGFNEVAVYDTLNAARLYFPEIKRQDLKLWKKGKLPGQLIGRQSLESWGYRLGCHKGDFKGPWDQWTQEMEDYCVQDVEVARRLREYLQSLAVRAEEAEALEFAVQWIIARQERNGIGFDEQGAVALLAKLVAERERLVAEVRGHYPALWIPKAAKVPKKSRCMRSGYPCPTYFTEGAPYTPVTLEQFNPTSRDHVAAAFTRFEGWVPREFTDDGKPKVDDDILRNLPYPAAKPLAELFMLGKRLGQLAEGKQAWMRLSKNGIIYGQITTNGAVTGRMTHYEPNLGQVPASRSPFGHECRALFRPTRKGWVQVGADASGLELRALAGYMAKYDGGAYVSVVLQSDDPEVKAAGGDMHSCNCRAIGLDPKALYFGAEKGRDIAKTWFYAFLYGAGDGKLGSIVIRMSPSEFKAIARGRADRAKFFKSLPALGELVEAIKKTAASRGYLKGLDGRPLYVRSSHAALNTLLQSAGAVLMKRALVLLDQHLQTELHLTPGEDYEFLANVHDEWQIECRPELADAVGEACRDAIRRAGESFQFRCPLTGEYAVGNSWAETH